MIFTNCSSLKSFFSNHPLYPSITISLVPPTSVAIQGIPNDKASMIDTGIPSDKLTFKKRSN